jgi:hypothetical protein
MKLIFTLLISVGFLAEARQLPQPKTLGPAQVPVFFHSKYQKLMKTDSSGAYISSKVALRWGTQRYEIGTLIYKCQKSKCEVHDYQYLATYESCKIVKEKLSCRGRVSGNDGPTRDYSSDRRLRRDDWNYTAPGDGLDDFPERNHSDDDFSFYGI